MKVREIIDDYTECNKFEIKIIDDKVKIYYYDKIDFFSSKKILVTKNSKEINVEGKKLVIETMIEELVVISGTIDKISFGVKNE